MPHIRSVAVFCGSQPGRTPAFRAAATELGQGLAAAGIRLIFGGGQIGLMGAVADAVMAGGGEAIGVIPEFLTRREVAHAGLTEQIVTDSMHTRKRRMFDLVDAFITMPGGLGTFDETFEILTWKQLRLHDKPVLLCDIEGWAQPLVAVIEAAITGGFTAGEARGYYELLPDVPAVLTRLAALQAGPPVSSGRL